MRARRGQTPDGNDFEVTAEVFYGRRYHETPRRVSVKANVPLSTAADFLVPLTLLPAMLREETLEIEGAVSPQLAGNVEALEKLLIAFGPAFGQTPAPVEFVAESAPPRMAADGRGVACFFSGGVDSLYTVLQNRDEIDTLIFVHGFDLLLADTDLRERVLTMVRRAAGRLALPLIEIETDLRTLSNPTARWELYHGGAFAALALLLAPHFRKVHIAGPDSILRLYANGTHPMLDPLWGTEAVELVPDATAERWEKLLYLANCGFDCSDLRVCYENRGGAMNCGRCDKCVMTAAMTRALGISAAFPSLPREIDLDLVARINCGSLVNRLRVEDCILILHQRKVEPELLAALSDSMRSWAANLETRPGNIGAGHLELLAGL